MEAPGTVRDPSPHLPTLEMQMCSPLHCSSSPSSSLVQFLSIHCLFFVLLPLLLLLHSTIAFPSAGESVILIPADSQSHLFPVFGLLQMNDRIRPPPLSSYAALPLQDHWMFVRPVQSRSYDRLAPAHLWQKRALMRLGKRAMMRLGRKK